MSVITTYILHRKSTKPALRAAFEVDDEEPRRVRISLYKGDFKYDILHHTTSTGERWKIHNNIWYSAEVGREVWSGLVNRLGYTAPSMNTETP